MNSHTYMDDYAGYFTWEKAQKQPDGSQYCQLIVQ